MLHGGTQYLRTGLRFTWRKAIQEPTCYMAESNAREPTCYMAETSTTYKRTYMLHQHMEESKTRGH